MTKPENNPSLNNPADNMALSENAQMLANRLQKNLKHLSKWVKRENIHCYRLYDADIPEYAIAIDIYQVNTPVETLFVHVQEYDAPKTIDAGKAQLRLNESLEVIKQVLKVSEDQIFLKIRKQQKGKAQYEKLDSQKQFYQVVEGGNQFLVNFRDYLDTGLFLDHRITRAMLSELSKNRDFLNLFAYTGSASVYAARGGATSTTTVDMSKTYLDWSQKNMALNGFTGNQHHYIHTDCTLWLKQPHTQKYGLIFLDPPSFSTSKRMQNTFDVQRDHVALIKNCSKLLVKDGILIFSNNLRNFKLELNALSEFNIKDISRQTLPPDFERNPKIHHCWKLTPNS